MPEKKGAKMEWKSFQETLCKIDSQWTHLRQDFPQYADYLKKCELVITYQGVQYEFRKQIDVNDIQHCLPLLKTSATKDGMAYLFDLLKEAIDEKAKNKDPKMDARLEKQIQGVRADIDFFPVECLEIVNDFSVEIVFPNLLFEAIQSVKAHHLVNAKKTCRCTSCIRVYLY